MKKKSFKSLMIVLSLITITCMAMAYSKHENHPLISQSPVVTSKNGIIQLSASLTQNKIYKGGDGKAAISLTLKTNEQITEEKSKNVDMVVVLDKSGSMQGEKLSYAKQSILDLLSKLSSKDRFALVTYSDNVCRNTDLTNVTDSKREWLTSIVSQIYSDGSTNLGEGLQEGINMIISNSISENIRKIVLISDGLANRGITDMYSLSNIASIASEKGFVISTIGVGADFNEELITSIADHGTGNYYFLENPSTFASIFEKEFKSTCKTVASSLEVRVPLNDGITLLDASGFPLKNIGNEAVFYPGDLMSGQSKKIYLTFKIPVNAEKSFEINNINIGYMHNDKLFTASISDPLKISCVKDEKEVIASIDKKVWEEKIIKEDYSQLKQEVASDIKKGNKEEALNKIQKYHDTQKAANINVGSGIIDQNIKKDLGSLRNMVSETFSGAPQAVEQKQKINAKSLQFDGYQQRRK